ncbi:hypothetical protein GOARA_063_00290 [Gordonia araii NBRC 100433]|uniref:Uncharacterized protein n=1 Tax=Gordonia araii NBRC 100433 TaxID=1073574 RepID=G7H4Q5_9ACTN|nr:hypothetical protein GOARA_063_00290 [Gordonia araii NBRC 100433]
MVVDLRAELLLLDYGHLLVATRLALLLRCFVLELAVVHDLADRWTGVGRDFHQIQIGFLGQSERILNAHDAHLLTVRSDKSDLRDADALVDASLSADGAS